MKNIRLSVFFFFNYAQANLHLFFYICYYRGFFFYTREWVNGWVKTIAILIVLNVTKLNKTCGFQRLSNARAIRAKMLVAKNDECNFKISTWQSRGCSYYYKCARRDILHGVKAINIHGYNLNKCPSLWNRIKY